MVAICWPFNIESIGQVRKNAIHIYPSLFDEGDAGLNCWKLFRLSHSNFIVSSRDQGSLANTKQKKEGTSKSRDDALMICVGDKQFRVVEMSSSFNNYRIYVEENPKTLCKNHVAAMATNREIVFGEAIVVGAKVKGPWPRVARSVDVREFMRELVRVKPTLVKVFHEASDEEGGIIIPYSTTRKPLPQQKWETLESREGTRNIVGVRYNIQ